MNNILKNNEIDNKTHFEYSHFYKVVFWILENSFWVQKTEIYASKFKGKNNEVLKRWEKDYNNKKTKFVKVDYQ